MSSDYLDFAQCYDLLQYLQQTEMLMPEIASGEEDGDGLSEKQMESIISQIVSTYENQKIKVLNDDSVVTRYDQDLSLLWGKFAEKEYEEPLSARMRAQGEQALNHQSQKDASAKNAGRRSTKQRHEESLHLLRQRLLWQHKKRENDEAMTKKKKEIEELQSAASAREREMLRMMLVEEDAARKHREGMENARRDRLMRELADLEALQVADKSSHERELRAAQLAKDHKDARTKRDVARETETSQSVANAAQVEEAAEAVRREKAAADAKALEMDPETLAREREEREYIEALAAAQQHVVEHAEEMRVATEQAAALRAKWEAEQEYHPDDVQQLHTSNMSILGSLIAEDDAGAGADGSELLHTPSSEVVIDLSSPTNDPSSSSSPSRFMSQIENAHNASAGKLQTGPWSEERPAAAAAGNQESEDSLIAQRRRIREEWAKKKQKQEADIVAIHVPDVIRTPLEKFWDMCVPDGGVSEYDYCTMHLNVAKVCALGLANERRNQYRANGWNLDIQTRARESIASSWKRVVSLKGGKMPRKKFFLSVLSAVRSRNRGAILRAETELSRFLYRLFTCVVNESGPYPDWMKIDDIKVSKRPTLEGEDRIPEWTEADELRAQVEKNRDYSIDVSPRGHRSSSMMMRERLECASGVTMKLDGAFDVWQEAADKIDQNAGLEMALAQHMASIEAEYEQDALDGLSVDIDDSALLKMINSSHLVSTPASRVTSHSSRGSLRGGPMSPNTRGRALLQSTLLPTHMEETTAPKHANEHPLSNNSDGAMVTQGSLASRLGSGGSGDDDNDHGSHLRDVVFSADDMAVLLQDPFDVMNLIEDDIEAEREGNKMQYMESGLSPTEASVNLPSLTRAKSKQRKLQRQNRVGAALRFLKSQSLQFMSKEEVLTTIKHALNHLEDEGDAIHMDKNRIVEDKDADILAMTGDSTPITQSQKAVFNINVSQATPTSADQRFMFPEVASISPIPMRADNNADTMDSLGKSKLTAFAESLRGRGNRSTLQTLWDEGQAEGRQIGYSNLSGASGGDASINRSRRRTALPVLEKTGGPNGSAVMDRISKRRGSLGMADVPSGPFGFGSSSSRRRGSITDRGTPSASRSRRGSPSLSRRMSLEFMSEEQKKYMDVKSQDELNKRKLCDFFKDNMDAWRKLFAVENTSAAHTSNLTTFLSLYFSGSHTNSYEVMKQVTKTKRKFESVDHLRNFLQSRVLEQDEKIKENETKHGDKLELFIQDNAKHLLTSSSIMLKSEIEKVVSLRRSKDVLRILKRFVSKSKKFTHVDQLMRAVKISVGFRVGDALLMRIHQHIEDNHLRLRELFKQFDQDEDGRLNERELRSLLINLKIVPERSVMKGDIVALLAVIDTQEMGYATMSSFHQAMKIYGALNKAKQKRLLDAEIPLPDEIDASIMDTLQKRTRGERRKTSVAFFERLAMHKKKVDRGDNTIIDASRAATNLAGEVLSVMSPAVRSPNPAVKSPNPGDGGSRRSSQPGDGQIRSRSPYTFDISGPGDQPSTSEDKQASAMHRIMRRALLQRRRGSGGGSKSGVSSTEGSSAASTAASPRQSSFRQVLSRRSSTSKTPKIGSPVIQIVQYEDIDKSVTVTSLGGGQQLPLSVRSKRSSGENRKTTSDSNSNRGSKKSSLTSTPTRDRSRRSSVTFGFEPDVPELISSLVINNLPTPVTPRTQSKSTAPPTERVTLPSITGSLVTLDDDGHVAAAPVPRRASGLTIPIALDERVDTPPIFSPKTSAPPVIDGAFDAATSGSVKSPAQQTRGIALSVAEPTLLSTPVPELDSASVSSVRAVTPEITTNPVTSRETVATPETLVMPSIPHAISDPISVRSNRDDSFSPSVSVVTIGEGNLTVTRVDGGSGAVSVTTSASPLHESVTLSPTAYARPRSRAASRSASLLPDGVTLPKGVAPFPTGSARPRGRGKGGNLNQRSMSVLLKVTPQDDLTKRHTFDPQMAREQGLSPFGLDPKVLLKEAENMLVREEVLDQSLADGLTLPFISVNAEEDALTSQRANQPVKPPGRISGSQTDRSGPRYGRASMKSRASLTRQQLRQMHAASGSDTDSQTASELKQQTLSQVIPEGFMRVSNSSSSRTSIGSTSARLLSDGRERRQGRDALADATAPKPHPPADGKQRDGMVFNARGGRQHRQALIVDHKSFAPKLGALKLLQNPPSNLATGNPVNANRRSAGVVRGSASARRSLVQNP